MFHENLNVIHGKNNMSGRSYEKETVKKVQKIQVYGRKEGRKFMADKMFENNQVSIVGEIVSAFRFSHEV